jgi:predicted acyltransferase
MLIVNNFAADHAGYFWFHADYVHPWPMDYLRDWWTEFHAGSGWHLLLRLPFIVPLFRQCTLADYVMPSFMLIIGLAIPYSVASSKSKNVSPSLMWLRTLKRAAMLVLLGWIIGNTIGLSDWLHTNRQQPFALELGMNVLQLLGVGYLVARVLYELPAYPRTGAAIILLLWHWALLRFYPQGNLPRGTFTEKHEAVGYIYHTWRFFQGWTIGSAHHFHATLSPVGLLSVPPAAATMLLGSVAGDWMRRKDISDHVKLKRLACFGALAAVVGFLWSFDLPFNKPRWTPCYLLYVSGVGFLLIALLYYLIDLKQSRWWIRPFLVFGANSIAVYFISIEVKVLLLNTPRVTLANGSKLSVGSYFIDQLKHALGGWAGGWAFTILFIGFWWIVLDQMYRRKIFWKL